MRPLFIILLWLLTACSVNTGSKTTNDTAIVNKEPEPALLHKFTIYVPTGFYFLDDGPKAIKMQLRGTNEVYSIAPSAFASVENIIQTKLEKTTTTKSVLTGLRMTFDDKGTNDLKEAMGNPLHPKIAVVVADHLLYIAPNSVKVSSGIMTVYLDGFTDREMKDLQLEVERKR